MLENYGNDMLILLLSSSGWDIYAVKCFFARSCVFDVDPGISCLYRWCIWEYWV